ncbi:protein DOWNSTREAM OF FLC isoform X1 [Hevea brasiliensis]|uniref:protein DOWNSTREAM OF FLC isoform X1 n=1 Tax=Hevea brasiliensis TaxID=3981 RepID=UPI0025DA6AD6|nr:protein DOWNSTREAM OF FLC isoform X1 [Hevea brasiliensis]
MELLIHFNIFYLSCLETDLSVRFNSISILRYLHLLPPSIFKIPKLTSSALPLSCYKFNLPLSHSLCLSIPFFFTVFLPSSARFVDFGHFGNEKWFDNIILFSEKSATFTTLKTVSGARVRIECEDRTTSQLRYSVEGVTDSTGTYKIKVEDDHQDQLCYATLVSSPLASCKTADRGRSRAEVILTRNNGAISDLHFANSLGYLRDEPLSGCAELVRQLLESDE